MPGIAPHERRTGLLIPVDADSLVADVRGRYNAATAARGLPPHVTILFPFARGVNVAGTYGDDLVNHFSTFEAFEAELTSVGQFDRFTVDRVCLFEEQDDATWRASTRFGLG